MASKLTVNSTYVFYPDGAGAHSNVKHKAQVLGYERRGNQDWYHLEMIEPVQRHVVRPISSSSLTSWQKVQRMDEDEMVTKVLLEEDEEEEEVNPDYPDYLDANAQRHEREKAQKRERARAKREKLKTETYERNVRAAEKIKPGIKVAWLTNANLAGKYSFGITAPPDETVDKDRVKISQVDLDASGYPVWNSISKTTNILASQVKTSHLPAKSVIEYGFMDYNT